DARPAVPGEELVAADDPVDRVAVRLRPLDEPAGGLRRREDDRGAGVEVVLAGLDAQEPAGAGELGLRRGDQRLVADGEHARRAAGDDDLVDRPGRAAEVVDRI